MLRGGRELDLRPQGSAATTLRSGVSRRGASIGGLAQTSEGGSKIMNKTCRTARRGAFNAWESLAVAHGERHWRSPSTVPGGTSHSGPMNSKRFPRSIPITPTGSYLPGVALDPAIKATTKAKEVADADLILLVVPAQFVRDGREGNRAAFRSWKAGRDLRERYRGDSGAFMSGIVKEVLPEARSCGVVRAEFRGRGCA